MNLTTKSQPVLNAENPHPSSTMSILPTTHPALTSWAVESRQMTEQCEQRSESLCRGHAVVTAGDHSTTLWVPSQHPRRVAKNVKGKEKLGVAAALVGSWSEWVIGCGRDETIFSEVLRLGVRR